MKRRAHRGFTIIELLLVVTILGVLSSIAIPSFIKVELRAKQAERNIMMSSVQRAVDDYYVRENHYPTVDGDRTWLYLNTPNPDGSPGTTKRPWRRTSKDDTDQWNKLSLTVQGAVFYNYEGDAYEEGGERYVWLRASGDLDADGTVDVLDKYWLYAGGQLQHIDGETCSDCTQEVRTPASGLAY